MNASTEEIKLARFQRSPALTAHPANRKMKRHGISSSRD
jgi:hypothetical protein